MSDQVIAGRPLAQLMEWFPDLHNGEPGSLVARCPMVHDGDIEGVVRVVETAADSGLWSGGCDLGCTWTALEELGLFARRVPGEDDGDRQLAPAKERNVFLRNYVQLSVEQLDADPPPFEFVLEPYIPAKCVSVLTGPGGSNKTTFLLWLAVCRALKRSMFKGMATPAEGETVIVTCEDRVADYRRRLKAFQLYLGAEWDSKLISERIHFFDLSGELVRFVEASRGEQFRSTALIDDFCRALRMRAPRAKYVTVETISRVTGGVESNPAMAALVGAGEQICRGEDLTLTYVGHVSQSAARAGLIDAYSARGGSALGDSGRSSIGMTPLVDEKRELYARGLEITADDMERTIVLAHTKTNGVPAAKPTLLYRDSMRWGPVLVRPDFSSAESEGPKVPGRKANRTYEQLCKAIVAYVAAKGRTSGNEIHQDLGGNKGHFLAALKDLITADKVGRDAAGKLVPIIGSKSRPTSEPVAKEPPVPNASLPLRSRGEREEAIGTGGGSDRTLEPGSSEPSKGGPF